MPWRIAASMRLSSARPRIAVPFNVNGIGFGTGCATTARPLTGSTATRSPSLDFVRKILHHGQGRVRRRLAESANRCVDHRLRELLQEWLVPAGPIHEVDSLGRTDPAGRALATRLGGKELHQVTRGFRRGVMVREDHDRG